ncbi:MAG: hypothetical protein NTX82_06050 [Candidatus Parcubacteria bacterium]|nr:hypothetical protein [Candidatus Parcubacteria bacterium]
MITGEILKLVNAKLNGIIWHLVIIGVIFFMLAAAILFYPQILQVLFVIAFFLCSFSSFLIAIKISNIKDTFDKILLFKPKKPKKLKK